MIDARTENRSGCWLVRPRGVLDATTYLWLRDLLVKLALDQPHAVVVDLDELHIEHETALTVFSSAWMQVSRWPGVPILLVAADGSKRARLRGAISRYIPSYATFDDALADAARPPARRRASLDLAATPTSSRLARLFLREVCWEWGVTGCVSSAEIVLTELVDNVALHAGTESSVRVELRNQLLTIAVRDGSSRPAQLRERVGDDHHGNGLRIVAELARAWGCAPHQGGGKVVWASLLCDP